MNDNAATNDDFLHGAKAIGLFLGLGERTIYHFAETNRLPVVKLGSKLVARKTTLMRWFEAQEQMAFDAGDKAA